MNSFKYWLQNNITTALLTSKKIDKRNWFFATNYDFKIPISLQPNVIDRVVNRFCKRSLNDRFLFRFQKTRFELLENE